MLTKEERRDAFIKDLRDLLKKHDAELELGDDGKSYGMHSPILILSFDSEWNDKGEQTKEFGSFELPHLRLPI